MAKHHSRRLKITVPLIPAGLNGDKGHKRRHWTEDKRQVTDWMLLILKDLDGRRPRIDRCYVMMIQYYATHARDYDNLYASFKDPLDAARKCNIISEDDPESVLGIIARQQKVATRKEERTELIFIPEHEVKIEIVELKDQESRNGKIHKRQRTREKINTQN